MKKISPLSLIGHPWSFPSIPGPSSMIFNLTFTNPILIFLGWVISLSVFQVTISSFINQMVTYLWYDSECRSATMKWFEMLLAQDLPANPVCPNFRSELCVPSTPPWDLSFSYHLWYILRPWLPVGIFRDSIPRKNMRDFLYPILNNNRNGV